VHDNINNVDKWLFNFHEPNPWAGPNMFVLEIFMSRWIVPDPIYTRYFTSVSPGFPAFEGFFTSTTHDNDLHTITCPSEMPLNNQWYWFLYDVGKKLPECEDQIEEWSRIEPGQSELAYDVLGFQLMTIGMGVETIGGSWTFQFGDISLTDMRWGTGSAYANSAIYQLKTRADGIRPCPRLNGVYGYPNPLRPYTTYTNTTLDSDINNDGSVNGLDLSRLLRGFKSSSTEKNPYNYPHWDYSNDIIPDGVINGLDLARFLYAFQQPQPTTGTYQTGLGSIIVWMTEISIGGYRPDPPPGYSGPPWIIPRTVPYTVHYYMELWDILDWPSHESASVNGMGSAVFYNGATSTVVGTLIYAYNYPIHD
jgi:hypothetical protein